jgi:anthranilate synthase/aminodeoxychorismate synthase-like glutamine amidotransferase
MRLLLLDNYDSFTYTLSDYFQQLGAEVIVKRNDEITIEEIEGLHVNAIILSPGPGIPSEAGVMMKVIDIFHKKVPFLGVCLGHQALGEYFGAELINAYKPMHGKTSPIHYVHHFLFEGLPNPLIAMRYHSLILKQPPAGFKALAHTDKNELMVMIHNELPLTGIQFHPESIMTENGIQLLSNWLKTVNNEHK